MAEESGYKEMSSIGPWKLYAAGSPVSQSQQFLAVGKKSGRDERYLIIQGEAPIEPLMSDLEHITSKIMNGRNLLHNTSIGLGSLLATSYVLFMYALNYTPLQDQLRSFLSQASIFSDDPSGWSAAATAYFSLCAGAIPLIIAKKITDWGMTRGLSQFAVGHNYGDAVWRAIEDGLAEHRRQEKISKLSAELTEGTTTLREAVEKGQVSITPS